MSIETILRRISFFDSVQTHALSKLAHSLEPVNLDAGQFLFYENDSGDAFFIIVKGELDVIKAYGSPEERLLQTWGPGNFIGEMSMFTLEGRRSATVRAKTGCMLLKMSHASFRILLQRQPDLAFEVARQLSLRLQNTNNAIIQDLQKKNYELAAAYTELQAAQVQIIEKERLERELQVAHEIQESILPQALPVISGVDIGAMMRPARAVGGDLYDVIVLRNNRLGIVIGDVSDKGVPAAIFMALARSLLRAEASRMFSPATVLFEVNRHLLDMNTAGLFITVIYGVLDCENRLFTFVRAGHEFPFFFQKDGKEIFSPPCQGQALGLFEDVLLEERSVTLSSGSRIVLYTDGATDAVNPSGERFGQERLRESIRRHLSASAQDCCKKTFELVTAFQGNTPQTDDIAMVTIDVH